MNRKVRAIIVDGTEIMTSYTAVEIADRLRTYDDLKEENERLNNIINEMEKYLEKHSKIDYECNATIIHEQMACATVLNKLKELKENNNEN